MTKKYDRDFKIQTIRMIQEEGKPVAQVARELGISENTLYRWMSEFKQEGKQAFPGSGNLKPDEKAARELQKRIRDLEEENEILKKANALLCKRPALIYSFIHDHRFKLRVAKMCAQFDVSRSGYYAWQKNKDKQTKRSTRRKKLEQCIRQVFLNSRRLYGSRKIKESLEQQGVHVSGKTVARIMKELGLKSRTVKKYKATTNSKHNLPVQDNVLDRQFSADAPNSKWVADITYVPTSEGWLYLASIMDLYSRKIVGFHMDDRMTKDLVLKALDRAYSLQRTNGPVLHHSDRGSQYASLDYQARLDKYQMQGSMSRKGNCYDNACIESFHSVLKKELIYLEKFKTRSQAKKAIFEYITCFYNGKRIHSSIGYKTPNQHERQYRSAA
ncbi:IS3 family transposase [Paenibacillus sp. sptzw28]|uniref:IS3 family transposase n=1 Tax=Paenibacillus sp. sptzw28 TaxID=715179 RepID=UPI002163FF37|nr:IS3 family transposase [Paenibacillus sp. sptzw28]